ncbi:hypothetical protein WICPIJ_009504 [Wickerhamomyces pijperi]|uniref:Uncharacterized protein n=1 Tax=Wickerhamomyces pijperi TaxID=599730 RepID=A0A9P8TD39_WICPI|nr:hypothetical protein WICPIJ_009504 [Wickerhamomyces pijperi]
MIFPQRHNICDAPQTQINSSLLMIFTVSIKTANSEYAASDIGEAAETGSCGLLPATDPVLMLVWNLNSSRILKYCDSFRLLSVSSVTRLSILGVSSLIKGCSVLNCSVIARAWSDLEDVSFGTLAAPTVELVLT